MERKPKNITTYRAFKRSFKQACANYLTYYFYSYKGSGHVAYRDTFIQEYLKRHPRARRNEDTIIKALKAKAKSVKSTMPAELQPIAQRLLHHRHNINDKEQRGLYQLQTYFEQHPDHRREHYNNVIAYYIIRTDIQEIKYWADLSQSMLHDDEHAFFQTTSYEICRWKHRLTSLTSSIRFKYEWFAVYVAMLPVMRSHSLRRFAELMNRWYPTAKQPCTITAIDDYTFLLSQPAQEWSAAPIPANSKATPKSIETLQSFYQKIIGSYIPFPPEHLLMVFYPQKHILLC